MGLIRYIFLGLAVYFIMKLLKKAAASLAGNEPPKNVEASEDVIEICPECGVQKNPGHKCKK
jgi:hypothetical protein